MTFTAMRPFFGFSNGRDVSLFNVSHASGSISAFSVVLSCEVIFQVGFDAKDLRVGSWQWPLLPLCVGMPGMYGNVQ